MGAVLGISLRGIASGRLCETRDGCTWSSQSRRVRQSCWTRTYTTPEWRDWGAAPADGGWAMGCACSQWLQGSPPRELASGSHRSARRSLSWSWWSCGRYRPSLAGACTLRGTPCSIGSNVANVRVGLDSNNIGRLLLAAQAAHLARSNAPGHFRDGNRAASPWCLPQWFSHSWPSLGLHCSALLYVAVAALSGWYSSWQGCGKRQHGLCCSFGYCRARCLHAGGRTLFADVASLCWSNCVCVRDHVARRCIKRTLCRPGRQCSGSVAFRSRRNQCEKGMLRGAANHAAHSSRGLAVVALGHRC